MKHFVFLSVALLMCSALAAAPSAPASGEQIKWQVISSGGGASSSTNYKLSATAGQTATGQVTSTNYKLNQGFWQTFSSASCCVGVRGNVNGVGIIDVSDLSLLVAYLTISPPPSLPCLAAANVNATGIVDVSDLSLLVAYLTVSPAPTLPACP